MVVVAKSEFLFFSDFTEYIVYKVLASQELRRSGDATKARRHHIHITSITEADTTLCAVQL